MSHKTGPMEEMRHELFADMAAQVALVLSDFKISDELAEQCGSAVADHIGKHWGGQHITIPKEYFWHLSKRDHSIWEEFRGDNHKELARKHGLTVNGIYRLLARAKKAAVARTQHDLF